MEGILDTLTGGSSGASEIPFKREEGDESSQSESGEEVKHQSVDDLSIAAETALAQEWLKKLEKRPLAVQVDVTDLKPVYLARKDIGEKRGMLMSLVSSMETRQLALLHGNLVSLAIVPPTG